METMTNNNDDLDINKGNGSSYCHNNIHNRKKQRLDSTIVGI